MDNSKLTISIENTDTKQTLYREYVFSPKADYSKEVQDMIDIVNTPFNNEF